MNQIENKAKVLAFLRQNPLTTISTISAISQKPQSALVAFCETENLELIFETYNFTRKNSNLKANANTSFVIGWDPIKHINVQYEGVASPIPAVDLPYYKAVFLTKNTPCTEEYINNPLAQLYKVSPIWLRYSDYTQTPAEVFEIDFD
ncbi:hypothetical protein COV81_01505 [Candidatus Peregrinibacteria bacterium CG11_big_fil_rev_8_21_14_0_20_41_10]|nr:MAG: hypothetical protein COV81_01505 [Candidatus Peregrinibacteria bacterium CG11_big_fil_rev_8_21_14_0_20_41_10]PJC37803.1 MAG: hypothetical protein CO045_03625 [Candidatus Peregrinibacteria bacterium CG_4_9_14_0_2_um_filter_41_14]